MRSSKGRSRGNKNRSNNRSPANNLNRVFDSSGPEGKVRGTPQQIIDKYGQLARDAQLGNDRVAAENFLQHAEHYTRLQAEAQRDAEEKRQQSDQQNRDRQQQQQKQRDPQRDQQRDPQRDQQRDQQPDQPREQQRDQQRDSDRGPAQEPAAAQGRGDQPDIVEVEGGDSGLVETPETKPKPRRKPRARKPKPEVSPEGGGDPGGDGGNSEAAE